jgi:DNA-binding NarL/FixJ family response regulator
MDHFQKTVEKTSGITRINKTKKILLIGGAKNAALLNRQETYRVFHCDTVRQAWDLVYRHRPHLIVLNLANSASGGRSVLQECRALAGSVPIMVVAPAHLTRSLAQAHQAMAVIPASSIARSIDKVLQSVL